MNTTAAPNTSQQIARLDYLRGMLVKYAHRWYVGEPSTRMYAWVDEYEALRCNADRAAWDAYCAKHGSSERHTAYDLFA
jgi:hypothetical protein